MCGGDYKGCDSCRDQLSVDAMKVAVVTLWMAVAVAAASASTYPATWDNIDLDAVFANDRLVIAYVNCLLDRGACTPDAATLKKVLPEAIKTSCEKCTAKQKDKGVKAIKFMIEKKPDIWKQLANKYDPDGVLTKKLSQ